MALYFYKGKLTNKQKKAGLVAAPTEKAAIEQLERLAVMKPELKYIGSMNDIEYKLFPEQKIKKLKKKDMAYMFSQLSFLIKAGVNTFEAIEVLSKSVNINIARVCSTIKPMIIDGMSLADALAETKLFPPDIVEKTRAGENSNSMQDALHNISEKLKEEMELLSNIKGGLSYPVFTLVAVFAIAMVMLLVVMPQMGKIFEDFGAELPAFTLMLMNLSNIVRKYWFIGVIIVAILIVIHIQLLKKNIKYKTFVDRKLYDLPVFGMIIKKVNLLYFSSTLNQMLENGKNTADSMALAKKTVKNSYLSDILQRVENNIVRKGMGLYSAMADYEVFPNEYLQMIMIGVRTGNVSEVLESIYNQYRYEVKDDIKAATDLIQPISIILIGIVVGVFVVAMYGAIYSIFNQI